MGGADALLPDVRADRCAEPVLELQQQLLGALLPDAGDGREGLLVSGGHGQAERVGAVRGEHGLGEPGADAAGGLEQLEDLALVVVGEAVQGEGVLPDDEGGGEPGLLADAQGGQGLRGALEGHADTADLDDGRGRGEGGHRAGDEGDHAAGPFSVRGVRGARDAPGVREMPGGG